MLLLKVTLILITSQISSFSNYGHSVVKTMTTVTGELGFEDLFDLNVPPDKYLPIPFFASNFILWIIFLFLIPICLNNMLVSLWASWDIMMIDACCLDFSSCGRYQ